MLLKATDFSGLVKPTPLDFHWALGVADWIPLGNIGLCRLHDGNYLAAVRRFLSLPSVGCRMTYHMVKGVPKGIPRYFFIVLDGDFRFLGRVDIDDEAFRFVEDVRLVRFGADLQITGVDVSRGYGTAMRPCWMEARLDGDGTRLTVTASGVFDYAGDKNYIPIGSRKGLMISDVGDGFVKTVSQESPQKGEIACAGVEAARGSSPLLPCRGKLCGVVHKVVEDTRRRYFDRFCVFSPDLASCRASEWLSVRPEMSSINFSCGFDIDYDGNCAWPVCVHDQRNYLFRFNIEQVPFSGGGLSW